MRNINKKAAMELSIGTIVVIVIAVTMLILGMVFVRSIMCAGIGISRGIEDKMKAELEELFGDRDYGVRCMGTTGQDRPTLADGGTREVYCIIVEDSPRTYELKVTEIKTVSGGGNVENWILQKEGWKGTAGVGSQMVRIVELEIPRDAPATTIGIKVEEYRDGNTVVERTHDLRVDISSVGTFARAIC